MRPRCRSTTAPSARRARTCGSACSTSRARSRAIRTVPPDLRKPLTAEATFTGRMPAHPTGCAVCEVEVDPETGAIEVTRYASVDDAGQPINPLVLHGQVHGGIVQGLGPGAERRRSPGTAKARCSTRASWTTRCRAPTRAVLRRGARRGPDRRQRAAREGRRRGRHHAGARGGDQCGGRRACRTTASSTSRCRRRRRGCGRRSRPIRARPP